MTYSFLFIFPELKFKKWKEGRQARRNKKDEHSGLFCILLGFICPVCILEPFPYFEKSDLSFYFENFQMQRKVEFSIISTNILPTMKAVNILPNLFILSFNQLSLLFLLNHFKVNCRYCEPSLLNTLGLII